ncbi:cell division control protein 14, SIN component-domain-containing protein [Suillus occidentalis]|nr:cell division control protein 14, SIN component-domain-containing protein [Suillus occidentalis]
MNSTLQDALDDVTSTRSLFGRRNRALAVLEQQVALACVQSSNDDTLETYLDLQDASDLDIVSSRILAWIQCTTPQLKLCTSKSSTKKRDTEMNTSCSLLCQGLSIIQGVSLHHKPSKSYLGRRFSLKILIELLYAFRHTPIIDTSSGEISPNYQKKPAPTLHLTSAVLDTLLCVLVDSSPALCAFEEVNGVQAVVKISKRAGTPREVMWVTRCICLATTDVAFLGPWKRCCRKAYLIAESCLKASVKAVEYLTEISTPIGLSGKTSLLRAASTSLNSKTVSQYLLTLAPIMVAAVDKTSLLRAASTSLNSKIVSQNSFTLTPIAVAAVRRFTPQSSTVDLRDIRVIKTVDGTIENTDSPDMDNAVVINDYRQVDKVINEGRQYLLDSKKLRMLVSYYQGRQDRWREEPWAHNQYSCYGWQKS